MTAANAPNLTADGLRTMSREDRRQFMLAAVHELAATRAEGLAKLGEMLHVSPHTVDAWLKPETSRSASPPPLWAVELYALKRTGERRVRVFQTVGGGHVALVEA